MNGMYVETVGSKFIETERNGGIEDDLFRES